MANNSFHFSLITPERAVLETDATFAAFPAHDGEVGILPHRAPFLYRMGIGELRVETPEGRQVLFVAGGFAQMVENRLTLLTEQAKRLGEIDAAAVDRALQEALTLPMVSEAEFAARQKAVQSAEMQRHLLAKHGLGRAA